MINFTTSYEETYLEDFLELRYKIKKCLLGTISIIVMSILDLSFLANCTMLPPRKG